VGGVAPISAQPTYTVFTPTQTAIAQPGRHDGGARISLSVTDSTLEYVIHDIARQAHMQVAYDRLRVTLSRRLTVRLTDVNVSDALSKVLQGSGLVAMITPNGETIVIRERVGASQVVGGRFAGGIVVGHVTDSASGQGLGGAQVRVEGVKELSAVTSDSGNFTLRNVPVGDQVIIVRLFGYRPAQRTVTVTDSGRVTVRVVMVPVPTVLSGVVTTATGLQKRIEVGNDITVLNADSIMQVAPVSSLTQMLETRVPGLIVQKTSGIPGAPSRLRLRGESSLLMSDDPIVIVDGIRIYADQSGSSGGSVTSPSGGGSGVTAAGSNGITYAGPSALDQIDPNSIDKIEVLKGPSATAIYGSDAANGVIVVTTKRGRAGPTRWTLTLGHDRTTLPGDWPINWYNFGHNTKSGGEIYPTSTLCSVLDFGGPSACIRDSLLAYQALNDPRLNPLGTGNSNDASLTVSGGSGTLSYSVTGSASGQTGYLHLPGAVAQLFDSAHGFAAPNWMKNPDVYATYGGNSSLTAQLGNAGATITLNSQLFHSDQQQSALQSVLQDLQYSYIGSGAVAAALLVARFPSFYQRAQLNSMTFDNGLSLNNWTPWHWLPIHATAGLSVRNTDNNTLTPRDYALVAISPLTGTLIGAADTIGSYSISRGSNVTQSLTAGTNLMSGRLVSTAIGINVYASQNTNFGASTIGLPIGVTTPTSFLYTNGGPSSSQFNSATYGWYVQPTLNLNSRFFASPGFRLDGGSASGGHSGVNGGALSLFPKLDLSYVAVNRPPSDPMLGMITLLRPRIAFGVAGVQPGPDMTLRFLGPSLVLPVDALTPASILKVQTLGNTQLHPERSREVEGGTDIQLWNNRLSLQLTGYHKMRYDAIENVLVAPSTSIGNISNQYFANIGTVRNTGVEATASALLIDSRVMQWSVNGNISHNDNIFVSSNFGGKPILGNTLGGGIQVRSVPGFPLNGLWARPILGFADGNSDGIIEPDEVRLGDSLAYVGASLPNYELTFNTTLSFFNNRLSISTSADYQNGLTQTNGSAAVCDQITCGSKTILNDPSITLATEAALAAAKAGLTGIGLMQTVNTLRWNSLSVNYLVPPNISRIFRAPSLSLALQGSNLGLRTNYRGKDPNVNAFSSGNATEDTGQLPQPRLWRLSVRIGN
jgi:TonB-dependent SusC/RagA subfamily outer membrane receptor